MTEAQNRYRASRAILFLTLWLTLFVFSVKISAGWMTRSLSLLAESLHALIASFSTLLSLLALKSPEAAARREFWGHSRRESALALLLAGILGFAGLNLLATAIIQLVGIVQTGMVLFPLQASFPLIHIVGLVTAISLILALVAIYQAKVLHSPLLRFNANLQLQDVGLTLLVLAGLFGVLWGIVWLDLLLAMILVVLAADSFWRTVQWQLPLLVENTAIAPEVLAQIAQQIGGVTRCLEVRSRGVVGQMVYVEMHLVLHPEFLGVSSLIAERIEASIRDRYGPVQTTFYMDEFAPESAYMYNSSRIPEINDKSDRLEEK